MEHASESEVNNAGKHVRSLNTALNQVLFGQEELIDLVLTGILARGHILLEGLPGLGKTELVKGLSKSLQLDTKRVQFTPDLLPGDITGNPVLQEVDGRRQFVFQPGPIFTNLVLADEINRASPKTQSALLEAMQERRVTVLGHTHELPNPFFVLATQNPIELEGTRLAFEAFFSGPNMFPSLRKDIDEGEALLQLIATWTHGAARHGDLQLRIRGLEMLQRVELVCGLVFRLLPHGAGVEHDEVGVVGAVGRVPAQTSQPGGELAAIGHVDLTANSPDVVGVHRCRPSARDSQERPRPLT